MAPGSAPLPAPSRSDPTGRGAPRWDRTRTTRAGGVAFVGALVVAVVAMGARGEHVTEGRPAGIGRTASTLPVGPAPRVPYVVGEGLYVDGHSRAGRWDLVQAAGRSFSGFRSTPDADGAAVVLRDGRVVLRLTSLPWSPAVLSPDGRLVAWFEADEDRTVGRLVLRDVSTGHDLGRLAVDPRLLTVDDSRLEQVLGVDNDGTVRYGSALARHRWRPGHAPVDSTPRHRALHVRGLPRVKGTVWLSPDESQGAWIVGSDAVAVQHRAHPETRVTIRLPQGTDATGLTWESGSDLLVTVDDPATNSPARYLRCSTVDLACERAPTALDE